MVDQGPADGGVIERVRGAMDEQTWRELHPPHAPECSPPFCADGCAWQAANRAKFEAEATVRAPMDWDAYFIYIVRVVKLRSKDPRTKVGAITVSPDHRVLTTGYNGFPRGVKDLVTRWERPAKYEWVRHAEENAILNAAREGIRLAGSRMYVTGDVCHRCAGAIANAGIVEVITDEDEDPFRERRTESEFKITQSTITFNEARVRHRWYSVKQAER